MLQLQLHRRSFPIPRASHSFTFHCAFSFASLVSSVSDINITHSRSSFRSVVFFSFWSIHFRLCFSFFLYIFFFSFCTTPELCMYVRCTLRQRWSLCCAYKVGCGNHRRRLRTYNTRATHMRYGLSSQMRVF